MKGSSAGVGWLGEEAAEVLLWSVPLVTHPDSLCRCRESVCVWPGTREHHFHRRHRVDPPNDKFPIGFRDDTQTDDGWTAEGFVRTTGHVPQTFLVEVISWASHPLVRRLTLDANQVGTLRLDGGREAIVAIAGLTPETTDRARYTLGLDATPAE
jgi:hypothetical protein